MFREWVYSIITLGFMVTRGRLTEGGRWVVAGALLLCALVHFPAVSCTQRKREEMFCKNDHMKKGPETQEVGGEGQPCYNLLTCCTTNIILMKVDSKFLCFSEEDWRRSPTVVSVCLTVSLITMIQNID